MTYRVTDLAAVRRIHAEHAPRTVTMREVFAGKYPELVWDADGRPHAPHDGYICPWTERVHRGGEFVSLDDPADRMLWDQENGKCSRNRAGYRTISATDGAELFEVDCSQAQYEATRDECLRQVNAAAAERSQYVGAAGERIDLELSCSRVWVDMDAFNGVACVTFTLNDSAGNVFCYKKTCRLDRSGTPEMPVNVGDQVKCRATVKAHYTSKYGVKTTVIQRPKFTHPEGVAA